MRLFTICFLVFSSSHLVFSQIRQLVFSSAADSLALTTLDQKIKQLLQPGVFAEPRYIDSLRQELAKLYDVAVIGYKYQYLPDKNFTPIQDLVDGMIAPDQIARLSIASFSGKRLPRELYSCKNLEQLELIETTFRKLPRKLGRLKSLRRIALYNHRSQRSLLLGKNKIVTSLIIRGDQPKNLPSGYGKFKALDTLDLKRNNLAVFPEIHKNRHLKQLILAENDLTLRDQTIKPNPSLEHLALQRNKITLVPEVIGDFAGLKKLVLNYNKISDLDESIAKLKHLEELSLYSNSLKHIPSVIYRLSELKFLDLYFNEIEKIEDPISELKNLQILYLASNRIYSISENIGKLNNLRALFIHHNRLSYLPSTISNLKNLEVFRMNANHFVVVPEWIDELKNLKNLDISQNRIYRAPGMIRNLSKLELVGLTENAWENRQEITELADELANRGVIVHLEEQTATN